jgi:hypothetical protein
VIRKILLLDHGRCPNKTTKSLFEKVGSWPEKCSTSKINLCSLMCGANAIFIQLIILEQELEKCFGAVNKSSMWTDQIWVLVPWIHHSADTLQVSTVPTSSRIPHMSHLPVPSTFVDIIYLKYNMLYHIIYMRLMYQL